MDRLETRELEYFVTVAQELHFSRAAERLGIAQPPLSRAISRLERRIGVLLLERTSRRVSLTPAGQVFLTESQAALAAVDAAVRRTQRAAHPEELVLAVRAGTGSGLLPGILAAHDAGPVRVMFTHDQPAALRNGTADVALLCATDDLSNLHTADLIREGPVALLSAAHTLATRAAVTAEQLRAEPTFDPQCPQRPLDEVIDLVALGRLVVVVGESAADRLGRDVIAVPVADLPSSQVLLGWRTPHAVLDTFVRTAVDTAAQRTQAARRPRLVRVDGRG
jgi:DNA-binding transcriptional LysR family regulator